MATEREKMECPVKELAGALTGRLDGALWNVLTASGSTTRLEPAVEQHLRGSIDRKRASIADWPTRAWIDLSLRRANES